MQTEERPRTEVRGPRDRQPEWLIPALAGALAVIIAIVIGALVLAGGSIEPDVIEPAPIPTTLPEAAVPSPLEVTDLYNEAVVAGDWTALRGLYADTAVQRAVLPDETVPDQRLVDRVPLTQDDWDGDGLINGFDGLIHDAAAQHAAGTMTFISCSQVAATTVACEEVQEGHAFWRPEAVPTTWMLTIVDGLITTHAFEVGQLENPIDNDLLSEYNRWLAGNRPELRVELTVGGPAIPPIVGLNITPDTAPIHRELVAEWQAQR